ncbi:MAG: diaminopimelate decarboxylase, partial [Xanthomonadales bacterium]|nr:diaminopimelate decarboxylase [Xanthomonadales bacterium]
VLVTEVLGEKLAGDRRLVLVDAAMNDLLRPSLYGARHPIRPLRGPARAASSEADVVGPVCESGDFLGRSVPLPSLADGEHLAVLAAGAYGASMASNYNSRPRPAEVMVDGADVRLIRRREAPSDLWRLES